ncbi:glycoside hydrolase family 104 protein [Acinetobacter higginsii]|uniref:glycoside hydrolase family 24 protein n=1 Tax=Acinetobacter higginsii TaxID=70347 RepID=UPI001F4B11C1|nr:glycoside hydrolase family 104 protein [Acinetobacter higginsii]MCH7295475.1 glycoside hydrolase family 104 protein [Acinetobacter higginsii]
MAKQYEGLLNNPNVRSMLNLIAQAEGVKWGYNTLFGNQKVDSLAAHPNIRKEFTQTDGKKNYTTAAGRYQFLKGTWDGLAKQYGLSDFSPRSQDLGAIALLAQNGALPYVLKGDYQTAVKKSGSTWASLPSSNYAQPKRGWDFVNKQLGTNMESPRFLDNSQISKVLPQLTQNNPRYLNQEQVSQVLPQLSKSEPSRFLSQEQISNVLPQLNRG